MQHRNLLSCILLAFVIVALAPHTVSAQATPCRNPLATCVQVTNVNAPTTIAVGQPLTVTVTVSYSLNGLNLDGSAYQGLIIAILDHTENGKPLLATAVTPSSCDPQSSQAVCFANVSSTNIDVLHCCEGTSTASFTLTAPNQAETWNLCAFGLITQPSSDPSNPAVIATNFQVYPVAVTSGNGSFS